MLSLVLFVCLFVFSIATSARIRHSAVIVNYSIQSFYHILVTYSVNLFLFRCHNLVYASLCYCEHVTDAGVELLGTLPSLTSLDLSGCNIQDQGIAALGNNPRFRDLTLAECPNITDLGLQVRHSLYVHVYSLLNRTRVSRNSPGKRTVLQSS